MKRHIFSAWILLLLILLGLMAGCQKKKTQTTQEDSIDLYYLNTKEDGFEQVPYTPEGTDLESISRELLHQLSDTTDDNTDQYKPSVDESLVINKITLQDREETIDFGAGYEQLSPEEEILCRTAIVKTLTQIDGVEGIKFTINGIDLTGSDGTAIGVMDEDTFMTEVSQVYRYKKKVGIYYALEDGSGLKEVKKTVVCKDNMPLEEAALNQLKESPGEEGLVSTLPREVEILQISTYNNICYVDLDADIVETLSSVEDKVMVYSMVNTIIGMGNATAVMFTVEGESVQSIHEFNRFDKTMTFNYSLCKDLN